ncbi:MAG: endonuclease III, partial [Nanoarchaeota archaeon]
FKVLISCVLSLRTRDQVTGLASKRLFAVADNPEKLVKLKVEDIEKIIYPVAFYRIKAKNLVSICNDLITKYNGKVPDKFEELLKLKGVGKKTAAITMVYGYKSRDYIPVDSHVHIISNRLGIVKTKTPDETMDSLMKKIPKKYWYEYNDLLVKYGQNICLSNSPLCTKCKINKYCKKVGIKNFR